MNTRAKLALLICAAFFGWQSPVLAATALGDSQTLYPQTPALQGLQPKLDTTTSAATNPVAPPSTPLIKLHVGTVSQEYVLGPGDILAITDTSEDKAAVQTVPILPDGTAVTTYTGVIHAAGLTLRNMNDMVNEQASKWYVNPHLMVNLAKQRNMQVYLLGDVFHPGLYQAGGESEIMTPQGGNDDASDSGENTMGSAGLNGGGGSLTVSGALQMAGGLKETADVRHIRVTRSAPKQVFQVDLWKLMIDGDVSEDISLQPGDVVYVPKGGAEFDSSDLGKLAYGTKKIRMYGAFRSPGLLSMSADDDILSVISKAGGFDKTAVTKYVLLARVNHDGTVTTEKIPMGKKAFADAHSQLRTKLRAGDLIIAKNSPTKTVLTASGRYIPQLLMTGAMYSILR